MNDFLQKIKVEFLHQYRRIRAFLGRPILVKQKVPVDVNNNTCENPIFIIGVHRSGTSLVRRIINSHSNIACPPETFYLRYFAEMIKDPDVLAGLYGFGYGEKEAIFQIRKWASKFHELYRIAENKKRWADKTPQYISILNELEIIFGPKAQYIMVFRHPLDVVYSLYKRKWKHGNYHQDFLINTAIYVRESMKKQLNFIQRYKEKCYKLYYEKLILEPEKTLKSLFDFLKERWEPQVLEYHRFEHNFGTEDPVVKGTKGFFKNFCKYKALPSKKLNIIIKILEDIIETLGYKIE